MGFEEHWIDCDKEKCNLNGAIWVLPMGYGIYRWLPSVICVFVRYANACWSEAKLSGVYLGSIFYS